MSKSLMGLDNVEWAANILDESNKENIPPTKSKKELKVELAKLIVRYNNKEVVLNEMIDLINLIYSKPKTL